jgi:Ricin-type beta-trefoil lectin domain-like
MKKIIFISLLIICYSSSIQAQVRRLDFVPARHGFHFQNNFHSKNGAVKTDGLCGGMALAAFNYFRYNIPIPAHTNANMNFIVYFDLALRTSGADALTDYIFQSQIATYTNISIANFIGPLDPDYNQEFNKVKARIDRGEYLILGLKDRVGSLGHQVLVYGYDVTGKKIFVYDPNQIDVESVVTPIVENGKNLVLLTSMGNPQNVDRSYKAIFEEQELLPNKTSDLTNYNAVANVLYNYNYAVKPPAGLLVSTNSNMLMPGVVYKIVNVNSRKAVEVKNYSRDNGAEICQWDFHGGDNQLWKVEVAGDGLYYIKSVLTGKNLEVYGFSQDNGGRLTQWDNTSAKNQQWKFSRAEDGSFIITNYNSGKVMDINGASLANAGNVQQWQNANGNNQKFIIERVR